MKITATFSLRAGGDIRTLKSQLELAVTTIRATRLTAPFWALAAALLCSQPLSIFGQVELLRALVLLPLLTGVLLRLTAWIAILRDEGYLNVALLALGLADAPLHLLHTEAAMLVGLAYVYLPFMILPIEARLSAADPALEQAAADLGAPPWRVFRHVTLPLSLPGVLAGIVLVAVPVSGEVIVPALLGAPENLTLGRVIWDAFFQERDWPQAAALAVILLALVLLPSRWAKP